MTSKRQRKAGFILPDPIETDDRKSYCVTIPDTSEYRNAFFGILSQLGNWWIWEKSYEPGDTRAKRAAELWREILMDGIIEGCDGGEGDMIDFRDNPLDLCEVQYSTDGKETWQTAFRKDNCGFAGGGVSIEISNEATTIIIENNIIYDNSITNIAPQWEYEAGVTDIAICWAVRKYVDGICQFRISQMTDNVALLTVSKFAEHAIDIFASIGVTVLSLAGSVGDRIAVACGWALANIGFDILNAYLENDRELFEDLEARENVACWMFQNIKGATPQFTPWTTSLDDFTGGNDAENAISDTVKASLVSEDLYVNYLTMTEDVNSLWESLPDCPCDERWSHTWDFVNFGLEAWSLGTWGTYEEGVGVVAELNGLTPVSNLIQYLILNEAIPNCDRWGFTQDMVGGHWEGIGDALIMRQPPLANLTKNNGFAVTGNPGWTHLFALTDLDYVRLDLLRSCWTNGTNYGSVTVKTITLSGEGVDPFRHRETS